LREQTHTTVILAPGGEQSEDGVERLEDAAQVGGRYGGKSTPVAA
jgi:hypothetical protein